MNFKNEIQLRGILRSVKALPRGNKTMYSLSVETQRAYRDREGNPKIKKDIHPVIAWPGRNLPEDELRRLKSGNVIYVRGHNAYEPEFHVFAEDITISKNSASNIETPVKIG